MPYANSLRNLLENPGSFSGTPGYQFSRDQALQATSRSAAAGGMRGSGNVLAALQQQASGLASQDYGNQVDRTQRAADMEQQGSQFDRRLSLDDRLGTGQLALGQGRLGVDQESNRLTSLRDQNSFTLGMGQNTNNANRNANDFTLGQGGLDQQRRTGDQNFGLGMYRAGNDYDLGMGQNQNTANRDWWSHSANMDRNEMDRGNNANRFNVDMYNARTNRGTAQSNDWWRRDQAAREWEPSNAARSRFEDRRPAWLRQG